MWGVFLFSMARFWYLDSDLRAGIFGKAKIVSLIIFAANSRSLWYVLRFIMFMVIKQMKLT